MLYEYDPLIEVNVMRPVVDELVVPLNVVDHDVPLITETLLETSFTTYKNPLVESKDILHGLLPTETDLRHVLVVPLITETLLEHSLVAYTKPLVQSVTVGSHPISISFDSSNRYVYVVNMKSRSFSVINVEKPVGLYIFLDAP